MASWIIMTPIVGVMSSYGILINAIVDEFNASRVEAGTSFFVLAIINWTV